MKQLWAPWRMAYVSGDEPTIDGCLFCGIAAADNDGGDRVVERAELTFTVLNRFPYSSGHLMVVPRRHAAAITDLDSAEAAAVMEGAARAVRVLTKVLAPGGFNIGINQGAAAGASLDHFHMHVVPRWDGDTNFMPVLADTLVLPDLLSDTWRALKPYF